MNHLSEEQLVLYYYREEAEGGEAARHMEECGECRQTYASLQRVLNAVDALPIPEPAADYGDRVWRRIERQLPRRAGLRWSMPAWRWALAGAAFAGLFLVSFFAMRPVPPRPTHIAAARPAQPQSADPVLRVAVGDYLDRTQMVLIELANASPHDKLDISSQQQRAGDLVAENRLYRQTADHTGDVAVATVLDELDRVLLDITHAPSEASATDLERLRRRMDDESILFKIRVLGANVRRPETL